MNCAHCGAEVPSASTFCYACRKRVGGPATPGAGPGHDTAPQFSARATPATLERPGVVTVIAVIELLAALALLATAALLLWGAVSQTGERAGLALGAVAAGTFGVLRLACGLGLLSLKPFARPLTIGVAILSICSPISILVLIYMLRPGVRLLFSGRSGSQLSPGEHDLLQRHATVGGTPLIAVVVALPLLFLVMVALIGIIAAIAIPSLLRARIAANEAAAKGDARTVASAQAMYANAARNLYAPTLECLVKPEGCLPGYTGPGLLEPEMTTNRKHGYVRRMLASPDGTTFVFLALPVVHNQTGVLGFCVDQNGRVCQSMNPQDFEGLDGSACPSSCTPVP